MRRDVRAAILVIAIAALSAAPRPIVAEVPPSEWTVMAADSRVTVTVLPAGVLSGALHTHFFQPTQWSGRIAWKDGDPGNVRVEVRFAASSLKDHQEKLSAKDIAKVEDQTRSPRILDVAKYPEVVFEGRQLEEARLPEGGSGEFSATLAGTLTLHGVSRPLKFPIRGRVSESRLEATGKATFKQSEFGIKPYSTALGSIAVKDEVSVEIELVAVPAKREAK